mmetsp:Transcript_22433/g.48831  ORF Transcript_22433/g.48831 Transcript_22433/m.48831 type:complete len:324 (-) Transcript_22433:313-1284(-)
MAAAATTTTTNPTGFRVDLSATFEHLKKTGGFSSSNSTMPSLVVSGTNAPEGAPIRLGPQRPTQGRPGKLDVICDRGNAAKKHCGNQRFHRLVAQFLPDYRRAHKKLEKGRIFREIIHAMTHQQGARFMEKDKDSGDWVVLTEEAVQVKVGQQVRYQSRKEKEQEKRKNNKSKSKAKKNKTVVASSTISLDEEEEDLDFELVNFPNQNDNVATSCATNTAMVEAKDKDLRSLSPTPILEPLPFSSTGVGNNAHPTNAGSFPDPSSTTHALFGRRQSSNSFKFAPETWLEGGGGNNNIPSLTEIFLAHELPNDPAAFFEPSFFY